MSCSGCLVLLSDPGVITTLRNDVYLQAKRSANTTTLLFTHKHPPTYQSRSQSVYTSLSLYHRLLPRSLSVQRLRSFFLNFCFILPLPPPPLIKLGLILSANGTRGVPINPSHSFPINKSKTEKAIEEERKKESERIKESSSRARNKKPFPPFSLISLRLSLRLSAYLFIPNRLRTVRSSPSQS